MCHFSQSIVPLFLPFPIMVKLVSLVPVVTRIILKYSWVPLSSCPPLSWYLCCLATRPSYLCRRITFNISWKPFLVVLFLKKQTHTKHKLWNICFPHMHFKLHHFFFFLAIRPQEKIHCAIFRSLLYHLPQYLAVRPNIEISKNRTRLNAKAYCGWQLLLQLGTDSHLKIHFA